MANEKTELNMSVSTVFQKDGKSCACVSFSDGQRMAEAGIPECTLTKNKGFTPEELSGLKDYLKANKDELMRRAKEINVMDAFMGRKR